MMKKISVLLIVFCCCFVSMSFGQETNFTFAAPPALPELESTRVDLSIEKNGTLQFQADGSLLQGKVNMRVTEKLTLLSGDYKGWGYAHIDYKVGKLQGSIYYVFHNDEGRGMLSGDVVGVAQQEGWMENMTWRVATLDGTNTPATLDLIFDSYNPGKTTLHQDIWMPVLPGFRLSTDDGSNYEQETTVLLLPAPDGRLQHSRKFKGGGLEFGTYQAAEGIGTLWSFLDNTELVDPFNQRRFGTRDGALAGTAAISFQQGAGGILIVKSSTLYVE
jgi:hypothetical protein